MSFRDDSLLLATEALSLPAFVVSDLCIYNYFLSRLMIWSGEGRLEHVSLLYPIFSGGFFSKSPEVVLGNKNSESIIREGNSLIFAS